MSNSTISIIFLLSALGIAACHDSLAGGDYEGASLLYIQGNSTGESPYVDLDNPIVRASLFWNPAGAEPFGDISALSEQPSNGIDVRFPGLLDWNLFDAPLPAQIATSPSGARYAIGYLFLYRDYDSDGVFGDGDKLVGSSTGRAVLYAPQALAATDWPGHMAVPAGYHLISLPLHCNAMQARPAGNGSCGVPLGASCTGNGDCGDGGVCEVTDPYPWPGGDCVLPAAPGSCAPAGATIFGFRSTVTNQNTQIWVPACAEPGDCTRGQPFQCDFAQDACLPTNNNQVVAANTVSLPVVCGGPADAGT